MDQLLRTTFHSDAGADFKKRRSRIVNLTHQVEKEVEAVHMESVDKELKNIKTFLSDNPFGVGVDGPLPKIRFITHSQNHRFFGRQDLLTDPSFCSLQKRQHSPETIRAVRC
jgi:hypothetical protein